MWTCNNVLKIRHFGIPMTGSVNFIPNRKLVVIYFLLCIRVCQVDAGLSQVLDLKEMNRCYYHVFRIGKDFREAKCNKTPTQRSCDECTFTLICFDDLRGTVVQDNAAKL